jgi:hypothetical protein
MTKHGETARRSWDDEWAAPSGRLPADGRKPLTLAATFARALRGAKGHRRAGRHGKSRVEAPGADARRVMVKVRVVQVGSDWGKQAAKLHLAYLEREGVEQDGGEGLLYGKQGSISRAEFEGELPGEKHQFRLVISPEDAHELDLEAYVRTYMQRVEGDLGQTLRWSAVNHYNTDNPHAHVIIRGVDVHGAQVRMERDYVARGLRHRAAELATQELGPRPEWSRTDQMTREASLERYTSLDAALERRAVDGIVKPSPRGKRDPHLETALKKRLEVLRTLGLAVRERGGVWKLSPTLRGRLDEMQRRADALRAVGAAVEGDPARWHVIDRAEPRDGHREALERGVAGVLRWKGLDEQGHFAVVVETTAGEAYYLPISDRVAQGAKVGQTVEVKRSVDKDAQIEARARLQNWTYAFEALPEQHRDAYRARLEQLERMGLAERQASSCWRVRADFRAQLAQGKQQPYWQLVALRSTPQRLEQQIRYEGHVWLDRVRLDELGATGFGNDVREALQRRHKYLIGLGVDPRGDGLRNDLYRRQQRRLERSIAERGGGVRVRPASGFEGTLRLHQEQNGARFIEVRSEGRFFVRSATRADAALDGQHVRVQVADRGAVRLERVERDERRDRGGPERVG